VRDGQGAAGQGSEQNPHRKGADKVVTPEIAAEAAVWIARLHGPSRSKHMERECLEWQARSSAHRLAFERGTDVWMDVAGVDRAAVERAAAKHRARDLQPSKQSPQRDAVTRRSWVLPRFTLLGAMVAVTAVVLSGVLALALWRDVDVYGTGVGEQRLVVLTDGTRMTLNTSTRVRVAYDQAQRRVSVEGGEALFEVSKDLRRPFVVLAGGAEVTATGTAFLVRLGQRGDGASAALEITLVEGQVVVQRGGERTASVIPQPIVMAAGDRLKVRGAEGGSSLLAAASVPALQRDRPRMDGVLAWKRGEADFDDVSLPEALAEMNRYSATSIVAQPGLEMLRVSGVYKTGDNAGFARAVAALHGLTVQELTGHLQLARK
jgi:transmembrane sensor